MINLLPPDIKQNFVYARRNRHMMRWVVALVIALIGIGLIAAGGQWHLNRTVVAYTEQVEQARAELKVQKLEETQKRVEDITTSLKLVVQVLSREVLFSKLIRQIGAAMPENTVLTNLQITKVEGGLDLDAAAVDYATASQIKVNLEDPSKQLFEKADLVSISCTAGSQPTTSRYPCQVKIRALFTKNNPYLFINNTGGARQ